MCFFARRKVYSPITNSILDRNNFTNARLGGLEDDLGLTDHQYNTALMIMYVGYLLFQFPSNVILSKFPRPGIYLAVAAFLWGGVSASMAAVHSYSGAIAVRFFLGFVEAPFCNTTHRRSWMKVSPLTVYSSWCAANPHIMVHSLGATTQNRCFVRGQHTVQLFWRVDSCRRCRRYGRCWGSQIVEVSASVLPGNKLPLC